MSATSTPNIPDAFMASNRGWQRPGESANECYVRTQARNAMICRDNDAGTELKVLGRQYGLHNSTIGRILAENGRTPNFSPTPAGAQESKSKNGTFGAIAVYDPSVLRIRESTKLLAVAILRTAIRHDKTVPGMTVDQMRDRCLELGVAFPA